MQNHRHKQEPRAIFDRIMNRFDQDRLESLLQMAYELGQADSRLKMSPSADDDFYFKLCVLGATRVEYRGELIDLEQRFDSNALLSLLASRLGRPMAIRSVTGTFWVGASEDAAYERLLETVAHISRQLGLTDIDSPIAIDRETIRLRMEKMVWLDANELIEAAQSQDPMRRARALSLYRGEPFADFAYDSWSLLPREHLRDVYVTLTRQEARGAVADRNLYRAADLLQAALTTEPFEEELYSEAMSVNIELGRFSVAVRQALRCRDALANLGLAPSTDFEALERQLEPFAGTAGERSV